MWDVGIAKMMKERDNKAGVGPCIGTVVSAEPLSISILNGEATLQAEHLYITHGAMKKGYKMELQAKGEIGDIAITELPVKPLIELNVTSKDKTSLTLFFELKAGDEVLLIPAEGEQVFFIVDKVEKVGG